ncbi:MAG: hypothetical protein QM617_05710 [Comamonas sp.]
MSSAETVARYRFHNIFGLERLDAAEREYDVEIVLRLGEGRPQRASVTLPDGDCLDVNGPWASHDSAFADARRWAEQRLRSSGR